MSAPAAAAAPPASTGGKKKLVLLAGLAVIVLALIGGGAMLLLKKKPAEGDDEGDGHGPAAKAKAEQSHAGTTPKPRDPAHPPTFVPLDPFTVNLADRDAERFAQVAVTLEVEDAKTGEQIKTYLPAIRNNILLTLSARTAEQLLSREGKERLSRAIIYAAVQPLGYQVDLDEGDEEEDPETSPKLKKKRARQAKMQFPVQAVHYSNFIVQ